LEVAASYRGNWRDIVVFVAAILFTIIWWNTDHTRTNYWVMFVVMIIVSVAAGIYAARGLLRALQTFLRGHRAEQGE
jgi:NAD/NADP transhydrogenase beta subunit